MPNDPSLVVADLSGYGSGGPLEQHKAYDMLIQAEAGLISITGTPEDPVKTGIPTADIASGMYLSQAVLAALLRRYRTGDGATIEVSMLEATVEWMGHALYTQMHTGSQPARMGVSHSAIAPYDKFPTSDGEILIGVQSDSGWRALVTHVLDAAELADDPRFATNVARVTHRAQCDAEVGARTRRWSTRQLDARLHEAGVPAAQIKTLADVVEHEQLRARDRWRRVEIEDAAIDALLPPATFGDVEAAMGAVPSLGQHTRALLVESGLDASAADDAISRGIAHQSGRRSPVDAVQARGDPVPPTLESLKEMTTWSPSSSPERAPRSAGTAAPWPAPGPTTSPHSWWARPSPGAGVDPADIDEVVLGAANQAGEDNRNVARMAALLAGLPDSVPGFTVNRLCASGLTAVATARALIAAGDADLVVAGGVESMTRAPWVTEKPARAWAKPGASFDTSIGWRFPNPRFDDEHDPVDAPDRRAGRPALEPDAEPSWTSSRCVPPAGA